MHEMSRTRKILEKIINAVTYASKANISIAISERILPQLISFADKLGKLAIIFTIANYFLEAPDRTQSRHYQAWQIIDLARGAPGDGGRRSALKDLVKDDVDLRGIDLSQANLDDMDLRSAKMREAIFSYATLKNADFSCEGGLGFMIHPLRIYDRCSHRTDLSGSKFINTNMRGTNFGGAALYGVTFAEDGTPPAKAEYKHCIIGNRTSFDGARIQGAEFNNCQVTDSSFESAIIVSTLFIGGALARLDFTEALLTDVRFDGAALSPATLDSMSSIDFSGARLINVTIDGHPVTHFDGRVLRLCHTEVDGVEINRDCNLLGGEFSKRELGWRPSREERADISQWHDN